MQRRLTLLKWQRHELVLIIEHIGQDPVGGRRGKKLLGTISPRYQQEQPDPDSEGHQLPELLLIFT